MKNILKKYTFINIWGVLLLVLSIIDIIVLLINNAEIFNIGFVYFLKTIQISILFASIIFCTKDRRRIYFTVFIMLSSYILLYLGYGLSYELIYYLLYLLLISMLLNNRMLTMGILYNVFLYNIIILFVSLYLYSVYGLINYNQYYYMFIIIYFLLFCKCYKDYKEPKKIAILTWHFLDNYGSLYQSYALSEYLKKRGFSVVFINYVKDAKTGLFYHLARFIKYIFFLTGNKRKSAFYYFRRKHFCQTRLYSSYDDLEKSNLNIDAAICGGDQIWSARRFDKTYYLGFLPKNVKRYSYSPSSVHNKFSIEQKEEIKNSLECFKYISTREKYGSNIMSEISKREVLTVLDPVFLLNNYDWKKLEVKSKSYDRYMLVSFIGEEDKYEKICNEIKEEYKLDKIINVNIKDIHNFGDDILKHASPEELLYLIKHASMIVTDSYHITLFSIIFNKEFYSIKRFDDDKLDNQNERIREILSNLKIDNRLIGYKEKIKKSKIKYRKVNTNLKRLKNDAIEYIERIERDINDKNN